MSNCCNSAPWKKCCCCDQNQDQNQDQIQNQNQSQSQSIPVVTFTPDGNFAYVINAGSNDLLIIDIKTHSVVNTIPVGGDLASPVIDTKTHSIVNDKQTSNSS